MTCSCSCSKRVEFYRHTRKRRWPAEVQAAMDRFKRRFGHILDDIRDALADRLTQPGGTRPERVVDLVISEHEEAIRTTLREGGRNGTTAGRRMASRRFGLDIDFEQTPTSAINAVESAIRAFEDDTLGEMRERFVSDIETWLEQGLGVDEIADKIQTQATPIGWTIATHRPTRGRSCSRPPSVATSRRCRTRRASSASDGTPRSTGGHDEPTATLTGRSRRSTASSMLVGRRYGIPATRPPSLKRSLTAGVSHRLSSRAI